MLSPKQGRFLSRDPMPTSGVVILYPHPYSYASNNPVIFVDPSGQQAPQPKAPPQSTLVRICSNRLALTANLFDHLEISFKCGDKVYCFEGNKSSFVSNQDKASKDDRGIYKECSGRPSMRPAAGQLVATRCKPAVPFPNKPGEFKDKGHKCFAFEVRIDCNALDNCMEKVKDAINKVCCFPYEGKDNYTSNSVAAWYLQFCLMSALDSATNQKILDWINNKVKTIWLPGYPPKVEKPECISSKIKKNQTPMGPPPPC